MATLDIRRLYADGDVLFAADLDAIIDDIETQLNVTKLNDDNIQDAGITASQKLVDLSVTTGKLASSAVTTEKIATDAVTAAKVNSDVAGDGLSQATSGALQVAVDSSTIEISSDTVRIKDLGVTTAKLAGSAVTTAKIADANVTEAKLATGSVTTTKVADSSITRAKLTGGVTSMGPGTQTASVSDLGSVTVSGRPVLMILTSGTCVNAGAGDGPCYIKTSAGTILAQFTYSGAGAYPNFTASDGAGFAQNIYYLGALSAGTYTIQLQAANGMGFQNIVALFVEL